VVEGLVELVEVCPVVDVVEVGGVVVAVGAGVVETLDVVGTCVDVGELLVVAPAPGVVKVPSLLIAEFPAASRDFTRKW